MTKWFDVDVETRNNIDFVNWHCKMCALQMSWKVAVGERINTLIEDSLTRHADMHGMQFDGVSYATK